MTKYLNFLCCSECGKVIGFISSTSGPLPWLYCFDCGEAENKKRDEKEC
jgi:hypothetical protein